MPTRLTIRVIWVLVSDGQIRSEQATSQIPQPNRAMLKIVITGQFCALAMFSPSSHFAQILSATTTSLMTYGTLSNERRF